MTSSKKLRIGVVGAGVVGRLRARSIHEHPETELAAVIDVSAEAATKAVAGTSAQALTDSAAFDKVPMDAVVVSTPIHLHEEPCVASLALGRHVLCEKPLSNTIESCQRIIDAAKRAKRVLAVGFNMRYYPAIKFVKEAIDAGKIGKLDHVRLFGGDEGLSKFRVDWQYKAPLSGGGAMMDVGVHLTDVGRYLLGDITSVYGVMTENVWRVPGSEDNAIAIFRNPEGITASYHATWTEWKGYRFVVEAYGDRGMVRGFYAPMENLLITRDGPNGAVRKKRLRYPWIIVREKLFTWHTTALLSFEEELRDFLAMIGGRFDVPLADGYDGIRSLEVAAAVRKSAETGDVVKLPALGRMRS